MGYMRHHAILVTAFDVERAEKIRTKAIELLGSQVSELNISKVNAYASFVVFPDGSKEGWEDSNDGDDKRAEFKSWLSDPNYRCDWAEVQYGDEGGDDRILEHS